jgi:DNA-directed RNA polymerase sigma subunit (sigma70/sigma32)
VRPKRDVPIDRYVVRTMAEVGEELGITAQRVSQIEKSAFAKIKKEFERRNVWKSDWKRESHEPQDC